MTTSVAVRVITRPEAISPRLANIRLDLAEHWLAILPRRIKRKLGWR